MAKSIKAIKEIHIQADGSAVVYYEAQVDEALDHPWNGVRKYTTAHIAALITEATTEANAEEGI